MALWAGIDEAGYGPRLGPLVVAGTAFMVQDGLKEGALWRVLKDAVARGARGSDGRLVVNDSKRVYSPARGLRRLEEGVLGFLRACGHPNIRNAGELFGLLRAGPSPGTQLPPWFEGAGRLPLPLESNLSALKSKEAVLRQALEGAGVKMLPPRATVVFPPEFNRIVARTRNKSLLLFQKCGLILQGLAGYAGPGESHILVDKHGARRRYRRLLLDVFPDARIIHTHRDPVRVVASFCSMITHGRGLFSDRVDPREVGAQLGAKAVRAVTRAMELRDRAGGDAFLVDVGE